MMSRLTVILLAFAWMSSSNVLRCEADSALDLLGQFDAERLGAAYPPGDKKSFEELSRIVYRIGRVQPESIRKRVTPGQFGNIGDAITVTGTIQSMRLLRVPEKLVDVLEFSSIVDLVMVVDEDTDEKSSVNNSEIRIIGPRLPKSAAVGDRVEAVGAVLALNEVADASLPIAMVSAKMRWIPAKPPSDGWRLLSEGGVDVSELAGVASRNRKPLMAADNKPFYEMLAAAPKIGASPVAVQVEPKWIRPIDLLQTPKEHAGEWLRMRLNTVRMTKVAVTDPLRQEQLGSDHYFQIDANGDLENVAIKIQRPPGEAGPPVLFDGSYPVSLVMKELPTFLSDAIREQEGGDAVVSMISRPVQIEGFFFRLWSYESDKMQREGAGNQFGPLLMVARMTDRAAAQEDAMSVDVIGYLAAAGILLGLVGALLWTRRNANEDKQVRSKQQTRDSERLQLPPASE